MRPTCGLSHRLIRVCEIELSHMGKNMGNLDLVCEKSTRLMVHFILFYLSCDGSYIVAVLPRGRRNRILDGNNYVQNASGLPQ